MKKRIFSILTALCLCLTLLPTMAAAEKTAGTATEVKTSDELVGALADPNVTTIKLKSGITVNATENVKELTIDRPITLANSSRNPLPLHLPLTITKNGALTLDGLEGVVSLNPHKGMVVNGSLTVGAGCEVGDQSFLTINQGGTVTTQPAGENTISGLLSLGKECCADGGRRTGQQRQAFRLRHGKPELRSDPGEEEYRALRLHTRRRFFSFRGRSDLRW